MKIFNWVHRRFNHKDGLSQNAKKTTAAALDEKQYLLQSNGLSSNMFGSWKGGLLTIGTFGYDPLSKMDDNHDHAVNYQESDEFAENQDLISALQQTDSATNDYQTSDSEEEDHVEEVNPLMYAAYVHHYEGLMEEMKDDRNDGGVVVSSAPGNCGKDEEYFDEYVAAMMKINSSSKRERTTLAQLFSADSEDYYSDEIMMQKKQAEVELAMKHKSSGGKSGKLSLAKKIIGDQDGRPAIHKLNRLMRRILNRKIHPSDMVVNVAYLSDHDSNSNTNNNHEYKVVTPNNTTRQAYLHC